MSEFRMKLVTVNASKFYRLSVQQDKRSAPVLNSDRFNFTETEFCRPFINKYAAEEAGDL